MSLIQSSCLTDAPISYLFKFSCPKTFWRALAIYFKVSNNLHCFTCILKYLGSKKPSHTMYMVPTQRLDDFIEEFLIINVLKPKYHIIISF